MKDDDHEKQRDALLQEVAREAVATANWTGRQTFSGPVMAALGKVPRHLFVAPGDEVAAYVNRPQRIGHGQTISQPYIVALMTDLLDLVPSDRVLEVGTGSGYQAAVLAEIADDVWSVETVADLARTAERRLRETGYRNVHVRHGDGWQGWPEAAPFDKIIVTAAPEDLPDALVEQLAPGGRMVVPIGKAFDRQVLTVVEKDDEGEVRSTPTLPVAFVPMVRNTPRDAEKG